MLSITVIIAVRNEESNIVRCLGALHKAERVVVIDSNSKDKTVNLSEKSGAEIIQFNYQGGYPKKRQWALDNLDISTRWILLIDADEVVPDRLWNEIDYVVNNSTSADAYLITKEFHFMGKRFRFGGFSHSAVLLFRSGKARFEDIASDSSNGLDMEVHERLIVNGKVEKLLTPLIHEDFKGIEAYILRHKKYAIWEANVRSLFFKTGCWGNDTIKPRFFGNIQERRRFLKALAVRVPFEPQLWFMYHYFLCLGFLEGKAGLTASRIRANYIKNVRCLLNPDIA